jgi:hypothetical protein
MILKVKKLTIIRMPQFSCGHCSLEQQVRQTDPAHIKDCLAGEALIGWYMGNHFQNSHQ